ncbi:Gfo/Idh/MocA family protein [Microbacterium sp. 18062]|uniref:Gfo/Idh/MocA family protein n=1 Tax=Microbacterium sp. 18062 TaxID=2681410 RepID=UPI0027D23410|nr:Gfo/Idh/MocA family oxidoreductase [Microbacterium sp. 18062]
MSGEAPGSGFLGGGFMAAVHSRAARAAGGRQVALASSSPERARIAAAELGIEHAVDDASSLVAHPDVELVHVCTPNTQQALAAIEAGRHVICEKPLAVASEDARMLAARAHEAGLVGAVPFVYRYHPAVREARRRVAQGELGTVLTVDAAYLQDWLMGASDQNWRTTVAAGGASRAFADIGSHLCDLIEFVTGERIVRLTARTRTVFPIRSGAAVANEDVAAVLVELSGGAFGTLLVSQLAPGRKNALVLEIHGSESSVRFEQERPEELWIGRRAGSMLLLRDPDQDGPDAARLSRVPAGHAQGYQDAFNAFVADVHTAIAGEAPEGLPTFDDGVRAVELTDAVLASASQDGWIDTVPDAPAPERG